MSRYKITESNTHSYIMLPKDLFVPPYDVLSNDAKMLYALLLDRMYLSKQNGWVNVYGEIYLIFTRLDIQQLLNISDKTCTKAFRELQSIQLIDEIRQGLGKPNLIFICHMRPPMPVSPES